MTKLIKVTVVGVALCVLRAQGACDVYAFRCGAFRLHENGFFAEDSDRYKEFDIRTKKCARVRALTAYIQRSDTPLTWEHLLDHMRRNDIFCCKDERILVDTIAENPNIAVNYRQRNVFNCSQKITPPKERVELAMVRVMQNLAGTRPYERMLKLCSEGYYGYNYAVFEGKEVALKAFGFMTKTQSGRWSTGNSLQDRVQKHWKNIQHMDERACVRYFNEKVPECDTEKAATFQIIYMHVQNVRTLLFTCEKSQSVEQDQIQQAFQVRRKRIFDKLQEEGCKAHPMSHFQTITGRLNHDINSIVYTKGVCIVLNYVKKTVQYFPQAAIPDAPKGEHVDEVFCEFLRYCKHWHHAVLCTYLSGHRSFSAVGMELLGCALSVFSDMREMPRREEGFLRRRGVWRDAVIRKTPRGCHVQLPDLSALSSRDQEILLLAKKIYQQRQSRPDDRDTKERVGRLLFLRLIAGPVTLTDLYALLPDDAKDRLRSPWDRVTDALRPFLDNVRFDVNKELFEFSPVAVTPFSCLVRPARRIVELCALWEKIYSGFVHFLLAQEGYRLTFFETTLELGALYNLGLFAEESVWMEASSVHFSQACFHGLTKDDVCIGSQAFADFCSSEKLSPFYVALLQKTFSLKDDAWIVQRMQHHQRFVLEHHVMSPLPNNRKRMRAEEDLFVSAKKNKEVFFRPFDA